ncbi:hypothetical protein J7J81_02140 [bacterium]|nr:hypothetical protein [bacterium]
MFFALLFIILGVVFLLKNLGLISGSSWGIIWPLVLISFGVYILVKSHRWNSFWDRVWKKLE